MFSALDAGFAAVESEEAIFVDSSFKHLLVSFTAHKISPPSLSIIESKAPKQSAKKRACVDSSQGFFVASCGFLRGDILTSFVHFISENGGV